MKALYFASIAICLSACASVTGGSKQTITVLTPGASGASCSLSDSKGRVSYVEETPGTALVRRGDGPISVICYKDGYEKGAAMVKEKIAGANYGNLALGPIAPIGYFVDSVSGSAQKFESSVEVQMEKIPEKKAWETSSYKDSTIE